MKRGILSLLVVLLAGFGEGTAGEASGLRSLYRAPKTKPRQFKQHDIITIEILEESRATNDATTDLRRELELETTLDDFIRLKDGKQVVPAARATRPAVEFENEKRLRGRGRTSRTDQIRFKIAATVVNVLPNGNLVLVGEKTSVINDETTIMKVVGEVRPEHIGPNLTVTSIYVANMKLTYTGKGPVSRNQGRSIWTWILDWLWF